MEKDQGHLYALAEGPLIRCNKYFSKFGCLRLPYCKTTWHKKHGPLLKPGQTSSWWGGGGYGGWGGGAGGGAFMGDGGGGGAQQ